MIFGGIHFSRNRSEFLWFLLWGSRDLCMDRFHFVEKSTLTKTIGHLTLKVPSLVNNIQKVQLLKCFQDEEIVEEIEERGRSREKDNDFHRRSSLSPFSRFPRGGTRSSVQILSENRWMDAADKVLPIDLQERKEPLGGSVSPNARKSHTLDING